MTFRLLSSVLLLTAFDGSIHQVKSMQHENPQMLMNVHPAQQGPQMIPVMPRVLQGNIRFLDMNTDSGKITITPGAVNQATVTAVPQRPNCQDILELVGDTLRIENRKEIQGCHCDYTVVVPQTTDVRIKTGRSNIDAAHLDASFSVNMGAGFVNLNNLREATVDGGSIEGDITNVREQLRLKLGNSNIRVHFTALTDHPRMIDLSAGKGSIRLNLPEEARIQAHPSAAGFPFNNSYESDFPSVHGNHHFRFSWSFGSGSVFIKKNPL